MAPFGKSQKIWSLTSKSAPDVAGGYKSWGPRSWQAGRAEAVPLSPSACPARALLLGHAQPLHILHTPTGVLSFTPTPPSHSRMLHITGNPWEGANQQHPAALLCSLLRVQALPGLGVARPDAWHVAQRGRKRLRYHSLSCSSSKYHSNKLPLSQATVFLHISSASTWDQNGGQGRYCLAKAAC